MNIQLDGMIQHQDHLVELGENITDDLTRGYYFALLAYHFKALEAMRHIRNNRSQVRLHINGETHVMYQINFTEEEAKRFGIR